MVAIERGDAPRRYGATPCPAKPDFARKAADGRSDLGGLPFERPRRGVAHALQGLRDDFGPDARPDALDG